MEQEDTDDILPSPLDPAMRVLDIADLVSIGVALYCGWQLGEWWGMGLAAAGSVLFQYKTEVFNMSSPCPPYNVIRHSAP